MNHRRIVFFFLIISGFLFFLQYSAKAQTEKIQKGDIVEIRVFGHEELSKNFVVQQNGYIEHPFLPNIPVYGLTLDELRDILTAQGIKYFGERPIITVRFSDIISVSVTVLGQVTIPGQYLVAKSATIQGAITQAGGIVSGAQIDKIRLIRQNASGKKEISEVNLLLFLETANPNYLPELEDGDLIIIPGKPGITDVKVIGEVNQAGNFAYYMGESILDFIYLAGGPTEEARLSRVRLISPLKAFSHEMIIDVQNILESDKIERLPTVGPGDIIIIPKKKNMANVVLLVIKDVATVITPVLMGIYYFKRAN